MYSNQFVDYDLKIELAKCSKGNFGVMFLAQHTPSSQYVAVREFCLDTDGSDGFEVVCSEIHLVSQFKHPNIHPILNSFVWKSSLYTVSPLMCFGSCKDTIDNCFNTGFPEILIALVLRDVLSALAYMHRRGYIHGSIRASHILLNQTKAVLSCFRESRSLVKDGKRLNVLHGLTAVSKNSINWLAPEVLEQNLNGYTEKSDIYSLGITSCELANGVCPFFDMQPTFMYTEKIKGNVPTLLDQTTYPTEEQTIGINLSHIKTPSGAHEVYARRLFSDDLHQFSEICMNRLQADRWSALQLMNHSFFKQCRSTSILDQIKLFGLIISDYSMIEDAVLKSKLDVTNGYEKEDIMWDFI